MFDTIINKIRSLENTTLIIGGIGILLLVILLAYMSKRSKKQTVVEGEPQGHEQPQDCFDGVCQIPPHIKETLTQEEQVPLPVSPILMDEPVIEVIEEEQQQVPEQVPQQVPEQVSQEPEQVPVQVPQVPQVPQEVEPVINTEVLNEPMN
jgi:hypothetical protein